MAKQSSESSPRLRFLGGAGTVTGSRFLLEHEDTQTLFDCGLFQGRKDLRLRNWKEWPTDISKLTACVVTHGHIDHSGYLPRLAKLGYRGPIYCTPGTAMLLEILLPDAAHLQEMEAGYANKRGYSKHQPALPLYDAADAAKALELLRPVDYGEECSLGGDLKFGFHPAGHLLGSASICVEWPRPNSVRRLLISGDLGRYDDAYMRDPQPPTDPIDYLLIESTYGNRVHEGGAVEEELARIVNDAVARGGVLLIPAFAVGRTQEILFFLRRLEDSGAIPQLPVYVDSPMAINATVAYNNFAGELNFDWDPVSSPIMTANTIFTRTPAESKALAEFRSEAIIISASGMATGGRILHHLAGRIGDPENTIMFAGFQTEGTRGRKLVDGIDTLRLLGDNFPVRAHVENFLRFSAHGDRNDLLRWAGALNGPPRRTFVVHGEAAGAESLSEALASKLGHDSTVAGMGSVVRLD
jgi:metallo-beta-lactamase family protein